MGSVGILPAGLGILSSPPQRIRALTILLAALFHAFAAQAEPTDVWIDTDMAFGLFLHDMDDGFAVARALRSERLRVRGISASFGNSSAEQSVGLTCELVARAGGGTEVFAGARRSRAYAEKSEGVEALARALDEHRLTIIALGPLTTVAALLEQHPKSARRIDRVIALAGRSPGYRPRLPGCPYPFADANYAKDPEAVVRVLRSGMPIRLVPWETAQRVRMSRPMVRSRDPFAKWMRRQSASWFRHWRWLGGQKEPPAFDSALILAAEQPELFRWERRRLVVSGDVREIKPLQPRAGARHFLLASPTFVSPLEAEFATAGWRGSWLVDPMR